MSDVGQLSSVYSTTAIDYSSTDQDVDPPSRGILCTTTGTLVVQLVQDTGTTTLTNLVAGTVYPFRVKKVVKSGSSSFAGLLLF